MAFLQTKMVIKKYLHFLTTSPKGGQDEILQSATQVLLRYRSSPQTGLRHILYANKQIGVRYETILCLISLMLEGVNFLPNWDHMGGPESLYLLHAARLPKRVDRIPETHCAWLAASSSSNPIYGCIGMWWSCSAPFPSDTLTGCLPLADKPIHYFQVSDLLE